MQSHTTDVGKEAAMGLVSLGYKKSDANEKVDDILTNNPNMTSDQVVMEVFNNEHKPNDTNQPAWVRCSWTKYTKSLTKES